MENIVTEVREALKGMWAMLWSLPLKARKRKTKAVQENLGIIQGAFREMVLMRRFIQSKGLDLEYKAYSEEIMEKVQKRG